MVENKAYYILHYNKETTEYLNDIIFRTRESAVGKFDKETFYSKNDIIEIIYSPIDENEENIVIARKYISKNKNIIKKILDKELYYGNN